MNLTWNARSNKTHAEKQGKFRHEANRAYACCVSIWRMLTQLFYFYFFIYFYAQFNPDAYNHTNMKILVVLATYICIKTFLLIFISLRSVTPLFIVYTVLGPQLPIIFINYFSYCLINCLVLKKTENSEKCQSRFPKEMFSPKSIPNS